MKTPLLGREMFSSPYETDLNNNSKKEVAIIATTADTETGNRESEIMIQSSSSLSSPTLPTSHQYSTDTNAKNNLSPQSLKSVRTNNTILSGGGNTTMLCRICYGGSKGESLIQPCNCAGTMGLMHRTCLEKWLSQSNSSRCEICSFQFTVDKQPRSFSQWLFRPLNQRDTKNLLNDFLCFLILTPLAVISTWYCVIFAMKFHQAENRWEASGLIVLTTFLLFIYVFWFVFSCKYHYRVFREWQNKNQIVTLKLNSHKTKLPPSNEFINPIQDMSIHVVENNHFELSTRNNNNNVACSNDNTSGAAPNCSVIQLETNMNQVSVDDETSISFEQQVIHGHSKLQRQSTAASSDNSIC